jgi:hypothetical protein
MDAHGTKKIVTSLVRLYRATTCASASGIATPSKMAHAVAGPMFLELLPGSGTALRTVEESVFATGLPRPGAAHPEKGECWIGGRGTV